MEIYVDSDGNKYRISHKVLREGLRKYVESLQGRFRAYIDDRLLYWYLLKQCDSIVKAEVNTLYAVADIFESGIEINCPEMKEGIALRPCNGHTVAQGFVAFMVEFLEKEVKRW